MSPWASQVPPESPESTADLLLTQIEGEGPGPRSSASPCDYLLVWGQLPPLGPVPGEVGLFTEPGVDSA